MLCEYRGHAQYGMILGHGRGDLPTSWCPHSVTLVELEALFERLREVSDTLPAKRVRKGDGKRRPPGAAPEARDWSQRPPTDTADVLARAVVTGELCWLDVLDVGWNEVGATADGWSLWLRPDDGSPPTSLSSANGAELRGTPSLTVHSSSVPWAEPGSSYSPAEVLSVSGRLGKLKGKPFAAAMRAVEAAATKLIVAELPLGEDHPLDGWPRSVFEAVIAVNADVSKERPRVRITNAADFEDYLVAELGSGPTSGLFNRSRRLVHVPRIGEEGYVAPPPDEGEDGPAQVRELDAVGLRFNLGRQMYLYVRTDADHGVVDRHVQAPLSVCAGIVGSPGELRRLRLLDGVIHAPVLRRDGSLLVEPGYDEVTRLLYMPTTEVPAVPDTPTDVELQAAADLVLDLFAEFPFVTEHDQANYLAELFLPLLRLVAPPPWPMFLHNAPDGGSGKTLLAQVTRAVHGGVIRYGITGDAEELRKALTSVMATTTGAAVIFDNVTSTIRSGVLAGMLTERIGSDRVLGATREDHIDQRPAVDRHRQQHACRWRDGPPCRVVDDRRQDARSVEAQRVPVPVPARPRHRAPRRDRRSAADDREGVGRCRDADARAGPG